MAKRTHQEDPPQEPQKRTRCECQPIVLMVVRESQPTRYLSFVPRNTAMERLLLGTLKTSCGEPLEETRDLADTLLRVLLAVPPSLQVVQRQQLPEERRESPLLKLWYVECEVEGRTYTVSWRVAEAIRLFCARASVSTVSVSWVALSRWRAHRAPPGATASRPTATRWASPAPCAMYTSSQ